jgi:hypothetical protein
MKWFLGTLGAFISKVVYAVGLVAGCLKLRKTIKTNRSEVMQVASSLCKVEHCLEIQI